MQQTLDMFVIRQHTIILMLICKDIMPIAAKPIVEKIILTANILLMHILQTYIEYCRLVLGLVTFNMFKGILSSPRAQRCSGT